MFRILKFAGSATLVATAAAAPPRVDSIARQITRIDIGPGEDCPGTDEIAYTWPIACTDTHFSPWTTPIGNWVDAPTVNITLAGVEVVATVDTGSTSLVASIHLFPNNSFTRQEPTSVFYTSSHWLEEGYEEWIDMKFGHFHMRTQAIIKVREVCCPGYEVYEDGPRCPFAKIARNCECSGSCASTSQSENNYKRATIPAPPPPVAYMGIGFGRGDAQMYNAFLNTVSFDGRPIRPTSETYCQGYVITRDGIHLGLTDDNTRNFEVVSLHQKSIRGQRDWATPGMQYQIDNALQQNGTVLVDTGIDGAYFHSTPAWQANSTIYLRIPGDVHVNTYTVRYEVDEQGSEWNPMQPVEIGGSPTLGFLNTGRRFLNCFDVMYDPVGGNYGYRYLGDTRAANCSSYVSLG
ncbi:hypothetical protein ABW21_db0205623 [Orbilia brochopaga]|nr:hypothetical protein ABW21_db0205623 [Drechslerella brochopaga]